MEKRWWWCLAEKLRAIDEEFEQRERMNDVTLSERLTFITREMESRYEERLNTELKRDRENEVNKTKMQFEQQSREQVALIKSVSLSSFIPILINGTDQKSMSIRSISSQTLA